MTITLSPEELFFGAQIGVRRRIRAILARQANYHEYNGANNWTLDIDSALAELAVAKALNLYWHAITSTGPDYEGDINPGIYVRSTSLPDGCLILHRPDPDDGLFYLAVGQERNWTIIGSILAHTGKAPQFWKTDVRSPAFFVPQNQLQPL